MPSNFRQRLRPPFFEKPCVLAPPDGPTVIFRVYRSLMALPYPGVTAYASLGECERDVLVHPVFLVQPVFVARLPEIIAFVTGNKEK